MFEEPIMSRAYFDNIADSFRSLTCGFLMMVSGVFVTQCLSIFPDKAMMRIISRLDIKGPNLIKGVQLEGLRIIGDPLDFVKRYYDDGVDEIILMMRSLAFMEETICSNWFSITKEAFIPITLGGGIRSVTDEAALKSGADKIAVNSLQFTDLT